MSVATSLIEESSGRITATPAETLYQFNESPLLARQSQQESNARSYPRRIPLALKRAKGLYVEDAPGSRQILSRMFAAAYFYVANEEALDAIIIFEPTDLGATGTVQTQIRERIDDLGVRLLVISSPDQA